MKSATLPNVLRCQTTRALVHHNATVDSDDEVYIKKEFCVTSRDEFLRGEKSQERVRQSTSDQGQPFPPSFTRGKELAKLAAKKRSSDGPLSVQDASDSSPSMNSQDLSHGQSTGRSGSSSTNHVAAESSSAAGTPSRELDRNDTGQAQVNGTGGLQIDQRINLKNLPLDEVLAKVRAIVAELEKLEEYHRGEGMRYQKLLGDFYWDYSAHRKEIGDALSECGYAALTVKMLKTVNAMGIFKNDDIWFPTYYTYNTAWNYSDASEKLAKCLAEADAVRLLTLNLAHKPYLSAMQSKNVYYVLKASLSTLHNIARAPDVRHFFKDNKTTEVIMPFLAQKDEFLKAISMLTLAYIVEEEENAQLIDDTGTIEQIVKWIEKATDSPSKRRFRGFAPWELTQGLDRLSVNDTNKQKVLDAGALPVFLKMLAHDDPKEQATAAHCIWALAFEKTARQTIVDFEGIVTTLETLTKSEHHTVKKNAIGALWVIKGENDPSTSTRPKSAMKSKNHIFISYSWNEKQLVRKVRDKLRAEGYKVWIDYEHMGGSTLEAMAEAVENSAVVLVCMSEKYKESANCRTEAEYTFQLRKDYIPLMMQKKYRPDGWLGAILGAKLFFDFSGKYPFEKSMQGLLKELRGRGQTPKTEDSVEEPEEGMLNMASALPSGNPHKVTVTNHPTPAHSTHFMTRDDVAQWLMHNQLDVCVPAMTQLDGKLLWQLKLMKEEAPQFFFQLLDCKLKLSFVDILRLTAAIDELH